MILNQLLSEDGSNQAALMFEWSEVPADMDLSAGTGVALSSLDCANDCAANIHISMQQMTGGTKE